VHVTQHDFVYTDSIESNYALVRKKSHKLATAGYISIAKERHLVAFFIYTEFPPCRVWLEHWRRNIWFVIRLRNPAQFPAQSTFFPAQFAPKIPHNFNFSPAPCQKACINPLNEQASCSTCDIISLSDPEKSDSQSMQHKMIL